MSLIDPSVFDFVGEIVIEAHGGEPIKGDSVFMVFGETFFDQFFGMLGHETRGFGTDAKRRAVEFVHSSGEPTAHPEVRRALVAFEEFCDIRRDSKGNYDGYVVDLDVALSLLRRVLEVTEAWVADHPVAGSVALRGAVLKAASEIEGL